MKTYIRRQQHKNFKHQDIKQKEPPQKYLLGTISNTKLLAGLNRFYMATTSPFSHDLIYFQHDTRIQHSILCCKQARLNLILQIYCRQKLYYSNTKFDKQYLTMHFSSRSCGLTFQPITFELAGLLIWVFCLFVLRFNIPVNNFSVMSGKSPSTAGN